MNYFAIGGSVSGLHDGTNVTLQNKGGDDLTVSANGGFTFATLLVSGEGYDVTVHTQPTGQTCTVGQGSGAVFTADVTDVAVTCVANTYTVGGSLSGLGSGQSVVLQNNGGDDLTVSANGGFTFATAVASGSAYDVTVLTPPADQSCSVGKASGTVAAANVSDVVVACRAWGTAALIETGSAGDANGPQIAVDGGGNAVAVWSQSDGTRANIWANRYLTGSGWLAATLIETDDSGDADSPQVAIDGSGDAVAVWSQFDGTHTNIWANRYTAGSGWGAAALIETDNTGDAQNPQVAIDGNGDAIAVWSQADGTRTNIWANRYTAGWGWGSAILIESDNGDASLPQVAADDNGNAVAVWSQSDGTHTNIWANRYTAGSGWDTGALIETDNTGDAQNPRIAIDGNGDAIAAWSQSDGTRTNIWANRYTAGGGWATAARIENDDLGNAVAPQIVLDSSGNAIAVWSQSDGTRANIWANRYTAGSGWGSAALIESDDTGGAVAPQVAVDGDGNAIAIWSQSDGTRTNIWANHYTAGSGWGTAALIENDDTGDAVAPQVAVDGDGNAVAVWSQSDGARTNIWANLYR